MSATATIRACSRCGVEKELADFVAPARKQVSGKRSICNECFKEARRNWARNNRDKLAGYTRAYRERNLEKVRENQRAWYAENPETARAMQRKSNLKKKFGMSVEDYDALLASQNGVCALCFGVNSDGKRLHVDHCHQTDVVRGLLCQKCNHGIGQFNDDPVLMRVAARYIEVRGVAGAAPPR